MGDRPESQPPMTDAHPPHAPSPEEAARAESEAWSQPPGKAAFGFIFATVALDMLALGIIIPVLPKLLAGFTQGDLSEAARYTGLFGTVWAAAQFFASPVLGALSDRFGRRPVILASNLGLAFDYLVMALAPSLAWLFVGRVLSGVTSASYGTASAYIADVTPPEQRAARYGMLGAAFGLGFVVGPALGGALGAVDLRLPFWVAGGLSLVNTLYGLLVLPESLPPERRSPFRLKNANPWGAMKLLGGHPVLLGLSVALLFSSLAHESLPATYVIYANHRYGLSDLEVGGVLAAVGIVSTLVQAGLTGKVVQAIGERKAMAAGFGLGTLGFVLYGWAPTGGLFLLGLPFVALWGLAGPSSMALLANATGGEGQGQLQGALASLRSITGMVGPIFFAELLAQSIAPKPLAWLPGVSFYASATLLGLAGLLSWWATRPSVMVASGGSVPAAGPTSEAQAEAQA